MSLTPPVEGEADGVPGLPGWDWDMLRLIVSSFAATAATKAIAFHLLGILRERAASIQLSEVRQDLAIIMAAAIDPSFPRGLTMN